MSSRVIMFLSPQHTWWPCGLVRMKPMSSIFQLARCCDPNRAFKGDFQKMSVMAFSSAFAQLQGLYYKSKLVKSINLHLYMKITGTISYKRHVIAVFHNSLSASEFWLRPVCWFDDLLKSLNDVFFFLFFFFSFLEPEKPFWGWGWKSFSHLCFRGHAYSRSKAAYVWVTFGRCQPASIHYLMDPLWSRCKLRTDLAYNAQSIGTFLALSLRHLWCSWFWGETKDGRG